MMKIHPREKRNTMLFLLQSVAAFLFLSRSNHDKFSTSLSAANKKADVICMGELLIDFVADQTNVNLSEVTSFQAKAGGAPANVAVGVQRLGSYSAAFVGCVGNDPFGVKLRRTLDSAGVDTTFLFESNKADMEGAGEDIRTTIGFVSVWDDGHKDLCFYRGADRYLLPQNIQPDIFENARCLHCGSITFIDEPGASAQHRALKMARDQGLMITCDPNYRPTLWPDESTARRVIFDGFKYAHMAKVSDEEFGVVTGHDDLEEGIQAVLGQGVELLVVSRGEGGALAATEQFVIESPALADLDIVETTGAGDGFMAAMISKILAEFEMNGGSLQNVDREAVQEALDYGNAVGGIACTKAGAIPALPTADQVDSFLASRQTKDHSDSATTLVASSEKLAKLIDHTFLKPYVEDPKDVETLCREAQHYGFISVAVNPALVEQCCRLLQGTGVRVGAAIGFPLGQSTSSVKGFETRDAIRRGATEIDMVINIRELQRGNYDLVREEVETLVGICYEEASGGGGKVTAKVILETAYLSTEEKIKACEICRDAGVDFVKTSTGLAPTGATVEDVELMRESVGDTVGVKASGGIRDLATARAMINAGATRLGTSAGVAIMEELLNEADAS